MNVLLAQGTKGKVISAQRSRAVPKGPGFPNCKQIPLAQVFRVSRYFSYWKSCPCFHRIISVISPVMEGWLSPPRLLCCFRDKRLLAEGEKTLGFRRRIFVQYLWRNEKVRNNVVIACRCCASAAHKYHDDENSRRRSLSSWLGAPAPKSLRAQINSMETARVNK